MSRAIEENRVVLHELKGVNIKVDFFLSSREELLKSSGCVTYSVCWEAVDVRVDTITFVEQISDLDFYFSTQQLVIDSHVISGEAIDFNWEADENGLITACCKILISND